MRGFVLSAVCSLALVALAGSAFAQGGTTSTVSGVVVDTDGGLVPGATVVITRNATGVKQQSVTNAQGAFSFPGLNPGTYTVLVTLEGFKSYLVSDVVLTSGAPASVRAVLELGALTEQIVVTSSSEIVQTQSATVSTTISTNTINNLPLTSRSAMDFVAFMPGVSTPGGNRDSQINGLPRGAINITLDGVNIQDNTLRSTDGFFAIVSPRLDAVEEVTVTSAAQGADGSGQGAVQIKFVTRSGSNTFQGSGYYYYRNDSLNANTWFNNRDGVAVPKLKQNQIGGRMGGPITIPGLYNGKNKAFFFVNYEEFRQPSDTSRNRTILNPLAQQGIFTYATPTGTQQINLLALAAANGQTGTFDPTTAKLLSDIRNATSGGSISEIDANLQRFSYNVPVESLRRYPTVRLDFNITEAHKLSSAFNYQLFTDYPDTLNNRDATFPGFPVAAGQSSERLGFSNSFRSTLTPTMVNEVRVGYSGAPVTFYKELNTGMFGGTSVANQNGYQLTLGRIGTAAAQDLTNASAAPAPQSRNASSLLIEDTLSWLRGSHSFTMGASWTEFEFWGKNSALVPTIAFGVNTGDPALGLFSPANFPGASTANIAAAQNLYALLTGRVGSITGDARLSEDTGKYTYMGTGTQRARMREAGFFVQDSWRVRPNVTVGLGLRYELQFPFTPLNSSYSTATLADLCGRSGTSATGVCNLFQAGVMPGKTPEFINFGEGTPGYATDWNNFAPSVGVAWTPDGGPGALKGIVGAQGDTVLRAGYSRSINRNGMTDFTGFYNQNPGVTVQATRSSALGNLGTLPVLFRDTANLGPASFPSTPVYPMTDVVTQDVNIFDPNIQVPWAESWSAGVQRALGKNHVAEVRYVGTRSQQNWQVVNYNEINVIENGFVREFRLAQANLQANIAAGRGPTFAYTGAGTQPLPTFLAYFNGQGAAQASNAAAYTGANWTSATFQAFLATFNPNPIGMVSNTANTGLINNATLRQNAATAGMPLNFFLANPDLIGGADYTTNIGSSGYDSLQIELRRRYSQGLQFQASYVFGKMYISQFETLREDTFMLRDAGTPGDLTHAFKINAVYELPFGQGRAFGGNVGSVLDQVIGGWSVAAGSRVQSGRLIDLGNVRLVGMTASDVADMFNLRFDDAGRKVWMLPQPIIDETIKAYSVSATSPTGYGTLGAPSGRYFAPANGPDCIEVDDGANYGACGVRSLVVTGPMFQQTDISIVKRINLPGRTNFEFRFEMLNAFNQANFVPVGGIGSNIASYEVTALTGTNTSRVVQLVTRLNW